MPNIIIARELFVFLCRGNNFLERTDIKVFPADSNDELLRIYKMERIDLIITQIDLPGMNSEQLYAALRADKGSGSLPVIMVCTNNPREIEKCARCGVSDVMLRPVNRQLLLARAQQFLAVFARESCRVPLNTTVDVVHRNRRFSCRSEDVGASGMKIETDKTLARGDLITCTFSLPGSLSITTQAEIVNVLPSPRKTQGIRYGVRFKDLPVDVQRALQTFVDLNSLTVA